MSGILEFSDYEYIAELAGIDYGEKCLKCKEPFAPLTRDVKIRDDKWITTINFSDPCVVKCGIWRRVKRLGSGIYKIKGEFYYFYFKTITAVHGIRGTTFAIDVADDGTTLVVVSEGEVEVVGRADAKRVIVHEGQQMVAFPQKPLGEPEQAEGKLLDELIEWKENAAVREGAKELEIPEGTVIELNKGRLNYTS